MSSNTKQTQKELQRQFRDNSETQFQSQCKDKYAKTVAKLS